MGTARLYRIIRLNVSGVVDTIAEVVVSNDAAALDYAATLDNSGPVEVWLGRRRIALLPPKRRTPK